MAKDNKYQNISKKGDYTKDDLDTILDCLIEASEVMRDKGLMKLVKSHAKKREKQVSSIADIRDLSNAFAESDD